MNKKYLHLILAISLILLGGVVQAETNREHYFTSISSNTELQELIDSDTTMTPVDKLILKLSSGAPLYTLTYKSWSNSGDGAATFEIERADGKKESKVLPDTDWFTSSEPTTFTIGEDYFEMKIDECVWSDYCIDVEKLSIKIGSNTVTAVEAVYQQVRANEGAAVNPLLVPNKLKPIKVNAVTSSFPLVRDGQEPNITFTRKNAEPVELQFDESPDTIFVGNFDLSKLASTTPSLPIAELLQQVSNGKGKKIKSCTPKANFNYLCKVQLDELTTPPSPPPAAGTAAAPTPPPEPPDKEYILSYIADNGDGIIRKDEVGFITIKPVELNVTPFQGTTPLTRINGNTFEFTSAIDITLGFGGQFKSKKKFLRLQNPNATSRGSDKINFDNVHDFENELFFGEAYSVRGAEAIITKIDGANINPEKTYIIEYAYVDQSDGGRLNSGTINLVGNQNKLTFEVLYSYQGPVVGETAPSAVKREGEPNSNIFILERDGDISITATGIKAGKTTYVGLGKTAEPVKLSSITASLIENHLKTNLITGKYIKIDPDKDCRISTPRTLKCTFSLQKINGQPITKNSLFDLSFFHDVSTPASGGEPTFTPDGIAILQFKPQAPACATLLECLGQLDQAIATKYGDGK